MKKISITITIIIILLLMFIFINKTHSPTNEQINFQTSEKENINKMSVSYNGWLHTSGYKLENERNENIQLRGLSSHGIEWFYDVITYENLENLKNNWNINVFRIAMYTDSHGEGYIFNQAENKEKVYNIIDMAMQLDMYVIVDWHILDDNNPQIHKEEAKLFFDEVSKKYANTPNVIYEICNEPNGNEVTWDRDIKPYAEEIIPIIRNNSEKSLIIVGTPDWCKKMNKAADNPLDFPNIVYSCHFYSGTHGSELREKINYCIEKDIPIFVSECGLTQANGNGELFFDEFSEWISYLNSKNISWVYWSFSNKNESSAILLPEFMNTTLNNNNNSESNNIINTPDDGTNYNNSNNINTGAKSSNTILTNSLNLNDYLTESGKFIKSIFQSY